MVCGVGINDADYPVKPRVKGKTVHCPFYLAWVCMLKRCYSEVFHLKRPTYIGCFTVPEWHYFMTFRAWMMAQDWEGKDLDKDLLIEGNKMYGPATCLFVPRAVNSFMLEADSMRGDYPLGVGLHKPSGKYRAYCSDSNKKVHIGLYSNLNDAHMAYKVYKKKLAIELASVQTDTRISAALLNKYL